MRSDRKAATRAAQAGRARLLIKAHLGWLGGYPGEGGGEGVVRWHGGRVESVDRAALSAARRAQKELHREHAAVLPLVVGDVDAWSAGVDAALAALKRVVHDGAAPSGLFGGGGYPDGIAALGARLAAAHPTLAPLLDALSWMRIATPAEAQRDLRWVARHAPALEVLLARRDGRPDEALRLLRLSNDEGEKRLAPLIALVGDPALYEVVIEPGDYIERRVRQLSDPRVASVTRPTTTLEETILALLAWLEEQPSAARRAVLRGLAVMELGDHLARWAALWPEVDAVTADAKRLRARSGDGQVPWGQRRPLAERIRRAEAAAPVLRVGKLGEALRWMADDERGAVAAVIAALPRDATVPRALATLGLIHAVQWLEAPNRASFLGMLRGYLDARGDRPADAWLAPFGPMFRDKSRLTLSYLSKAAGWQRFTAALIAAARDEVDLDDGALQRLASLVVHLGDADAARARLDNAVQNRLLDETVEVAAALTTTPEDFAALAARLESSNDKLTWAIRTIRDAADRSADPLLRALVLAGERKRLLDGEAQLRVAYALGGRAVPRLAVPPPAPVPASALRYPVSLHRALAKLDAVGATATGERMLEGTFPDAAALRTEIDAITRKLADASGVQAERLAARRRNLERALIAPPTPSPVRLARLAEELDRAADVAAFARWRAALDTLVERGLPLRLELPEVPPWLADPAYRAVFAGILGLRGTVRRLAHRLLHARCGPPPWDLRDDPANRAFVARLAARGIDAAPWIDGIGRRRYGEGSNLLELVLEEDPLEALRMGEHFATCLSPCSFNFFSAVVNAADINKRVIYGRDPKRGGVLGRCLLGLTDAGHIVTFNAYSHLDRARGDFGDMVRRFVTELAERMGTIAVPRGEITPLIQKEWYDDGPRDLTGSFPFLAEPHSLAARLGALPPAEIVPTLARLFAPLPLGGYTIGLVIAHGELDLHAAVIVPLAPLLERADDVSPATRVRAAQLAERAGRPDLVSPRLADDLDAVARARPEWIGRDLADLFARVAPSRLLAFLRETDGEVRRARGDEPIAERMWAAARALEELRRPRQAMKMYEQTIAAAKNDKDLRSACAARLAALGAGQAIDAAGPSSP